MIVLISGKQGSGKTTTADLVMRGLNVLGIPVYRYRFAQPIYEMHEAVYSVAKQYGIEPPKVKDGELLQLLGTEWGRQQKGADVWVNAAKARIKHFLDALAKTHPKHIALVDDLRFRNEFDGFPTDLRVRLECPEEVRRQRASYWRANTLHPSETDLDQYAAEGRFDFMIRTDTIPQDEVVAQIVELTKKRLEPK